MIIDWAAYLHSYPTTNQNQDRICPYGRTSAFINCVYHRAWTYKSTTDQTEWNFTKYEFSLTTYDSWAVWRVRWTKIQDEIPPPISLVPLNTSGPPGRSAYLDFVKWFVYNTCLFIFVYVCKVGPYLTGHSLGRVKICTRTCACESSCTNESVSYPCIVCLLTPPVWRQHTVTPSTSCTFRPTVWVTTELHDHAVHPS